MATNGKRPPRLRNGTTVHVRSEHFVEECDGIIVEADYDDHWAYRIEVTAGDRLDEHRESNGELWVGDFEVQPLPAGTDGIDPAEAVR